MDSAYQLFNLKNLIILSNEKTKKSFIKNVYPYNIDCIVKHKHEVKKLQGNFKIVFIGCFIEELNNHENIILDDFIKLNYQQSDPFKLKWTPENLATFISVWFKQDKIRKLNNNFDNYYKSKNNTWLKEIMI